MTEDNFRVERPGPLSTPIFQLVQIVISVPSLALHILEMDRAELSLPSFWGKYSGVPYLEGWTRSLTRASVEGKNIGCIFIFPTVV